MANSIKQIEVFKVLIIIFPFLMFIICVVLHQILMKGFVFFLF